MSEKPDRRTNLQRIKELDDQVHALEMKLDKAVNYSSGQDEQLKAHHGKLGLFEVRIAKAEKELVKLREEVDQAAAVTPPPPPSGPPNEVVPNVSKAIEDVTKRARESLYFPPGTCFDCTHPWFQHSKGIPCLEAGCICMEEPKSSPPPGPPNRTVPDTGTPPPWPGSPGWGPGPVPDDRYMFGYAPADLPLPPPRPPNETVRDEIPVFGILIDFLEELARRRK